MLDMVKQENETTEEHSNFFHVKCLIYQRHPKLSPCFLTGANRKMVCSRAVLTRFPRLGSIFRLCETQYVAMNNAFIFVFY